MMRSIKSMMMGGAFLLGLAMCLTSCEGTLDDIFGEWSRPTGNNGNTKTTVAVKSVTLDQTTLTKAVGDDAVTLTATVDPTDASDKTVTWKSSDASIAAVDANGKVTFETAGTATITATATNGTDDTADDKTATCEVTISAKKVNVESVKLDQPTLTATVGDAAVTLTATVTPDDATDKTVKWTSSDASIAAVDANGKVTFVAAGTATITATATNGTEDTADDKTATCEVTLIDGYAANEYNEGSWDSTNKKVVFTKKTAASVTAVTNSDADVTWNAGWYTVSGNVTINGKVTLSANTSLILQDGATLTINGQLNAASYDLDIYGQMEGTGKLNVTCNDNAIKGPSNMTTHIHGGEITATATGADHRGVYFGYIVMYSGKLTATAADYHAIGFESWGFEVYGGEVEATSNATSGDYSGIQSSGTLKVFGGKVKGTGGAPSGKGFDCKVQKGTSNIKFYFSDNGTTWGDGLSYGIAATALGNRYAKAE